MSRRTNKKRLKKINQTQTSGTAAAASAPAQQSEEVHTESVPVEETVTAAASAAVQQELLLYRRESASAVQETAPVPAECKAAAYDMFLQYQNLEFDITDLTARILDKCASENMDSSDLKIYVKPEDSKAYYVCGRAGTALSICDSIQNQ